jgi:hypothetical protein
MLITLIVVVRVLSRNHQTLVFTAVKGLIGNEPRQDLYSVIRFFSILYSCRFNRFLICIVMGDSAYLCARRTIFRGGAVYRAICMRGKRVGFIVHKSKFEYAEDKSWRAGGVFSCWIILLFVPRGPCILSDRGCLRFASAVRWSGGRRQE